MQPPRSKSGIIIVGNNDPAVSPHLKAWIKQGNVCVVGVIGEGTTKDIVANWTSPFEQDTLGGHFQKIEGLAQIVANVTSKGTFASTQVWEGNRPHAFNLQLKFYALNDAKREVMDALQELEKMMTPDVGRGYGSPPEVISMNIGRKAIYKDCLLTNMSVPLDGPRTKDGDLIRTQVTLQIETKLMLTRNDIDRTYG